jgi:hypothetical protein
MNHTLFPVHYMFEFRFHYLFRNFAAIPVDKDLQHTIHYLMNILVHTNLKYMIPIQLAKYMCLFLIRFDMYMLLSNSEHMFPEYNYR